MCKDDQSCRYLVVRKVLSHLAYTRTARLAGLALFYAFKTNLREGIATPTTPSAVPREHTKTINASFAFLYLSASPGIRRRGNTD